MDHVQVYVDQNDHGEITVDLTVINCSLRRVRIEGLHLEWVILSTRAMTELVQHVGRPVTVVPGRSSEGFRFTLSLRAPDIRILVGQIVKPMQPLNSPGLAIGIRGQLQVRSWRGRAWLPFSVKSETPELNVHVSEAGVAPP